MLDNGVEYQMLSFDKQLGTNPINPMPETFDWSFIQGSCPISGSMNIALLVIPNKDQFVVRCFRDFLTFIWTLMLHDDSDEIALSRRRAETRSFLTQTICAGKNFAYGLKGRVTWRSTIFIHESISRAFDQATSRHSNQNVHFWNTFSYSDSENCWPWSLHIHPLCTVKQSKHICCRVP